MKRPTLSITMSASGTWQAEGCLLGHDIKTSAASLWECLEQCKQQVWDIEIGHDVAKGSPDPEEQIAAPASEQTDVSDDREDAPLAAAEEVPVDLLRVVRHMVLHQRSVSVALVQRHLGLDHAIARRALASLEVEGCHPDGHGHAAGIYSLLCAVRLVD
jgi:hypothetical protein